MRDNQRNLYRISYTMPKDGVWGHPIEVEDGMAWLIPVESTKLERKLRDALNRISKLIPSVHRLQVLDRIAMELEAEADRESNRVQQAVTHGSSFEAVDVDGLKADALYLRRLEYDLTSMREAKASVQPKKEKTMRASSKYEPSHWPRGERP